MEKLYQINYINITTKRESAYVGRFKSKEEATKFFNEKINKYGKYEVTSILEVS